MVLALSLDDAVQLKKEFSEEDGRIQNVALVVILVMRVYHKCSCVAAAIDCWSVDFSISHETMLVLKVGNIDFVILLLA